MLYKLLWVIGTRLYYLDVSVQQALHPLRLLLEISNIQIICMYTAHLAEDFVFSSECLSN